MTWPTVRVGDVALQIRGVTFAKSEALSEPATGRVPILTASNVTELGLVEDSVLHVPSAMVADRQLLRRNDLLVTASSGSLNVVGRAVLVRNDITASFGAFCKVLRPSASIDPSYFAHYFKTTEYRARVSRLSAGANINNLRNEDLDGLVIPLPPLPEQRRIASILDQADELRQNRRYAITAMNELSNSAFESAIAVAVDSSVVPLADAYWFQEGPGVRNWQFKDVGIKLLNVGNILKTGQLDLSRTSKFISEDEAHGKYQHFLIDEGDYVIASSGISFDADGLLRTRGAYVRSSDLPLCMNTSTIRFKARPGISTLSFLDGWLSSKEFRTQISRLVTGSAQQNFGPSHLRQLAVRLPSIEIQNSLTSQLEELSRLRATNQSHLAKLDELFASLQHRAFRGEL